MTRGLAPATSEGFLNALCNNTAYQIAQFHLKLHVGDPGVAGASNAFADTTRQQMSFGPASSGSVTSDADTTWTNLSAGDTLTDVSFWTAAAAGTFLGSAQLTAPKDVNSGDNFTIASGNGTLSFTPIAA